MFPPPMGGQLTVQWLHFAMCVLVLRKAVTKDTFLGVHLDENPESEKSWRLSSWTVCNSMHHMSNAQYVLLKDIESDDIRNHVN